PIAVRGGAGAVERLQEVRRVVVAVEGVVVADEILTIAPAGLHLDDLAATGDGAGEGEREAGLPGARDPLQEHQAGHGEAAEERADVPLGVVEPPPLDAGGDTMP